MNSTQAFPEAIFLHFMDSYHWKFAVQVRGHQLNKVKREMLTAFRIAFLASETLYMSASAFMENPVARKIVRDHRELTELGHIRIVGADGSLAEHNELKREAHYRDTNEPEVAAAYGRRMRLDIPYIQQPLDVRAAVTGVWDSQLAAGIARHFPYQPRSESEEFWHRAPDLLEERAFVAPHILQLFEAGNQPPPTAQAAYQIVDAGYALAHTRPLHAGLMGDLVFLQLTDEDLLVDAPMISYTQAVQVLQRQGILEKLRGCSALELLSLRSMVALQGIPMRALPDVLPGPTALQLPWELTAAPARIYIREYIMGDKYSIRDNRDSQITIGSHNTSIVLHTGSDAARAVSELITVIGDQEAPIELHEVKKALDAGDVAHAKGFWSRAREAVTTSDAFIKAGKGAVDLYEAISNFLS